ncbi:hypothetical protein ENUP19_0038G0004 [Entamoeba nuttalli]|uniref:Protein TEX261 n=2 Tax=Entamoeba nuttalli TaxID=412467 RepID=A0ABQ0D9M5_9EUKA
MTDISTLLLSFLHFFLSYGPAFIVLLLFIGLSLAAGLYVFSLFVEEKPSHARSIIKYLIIGTILQTLLCLRFIPWYVVIVNLISQAIYFMLCKDVPYISYKSPIFFGGCVAAVLSHLVFAIHFLLSEEWHFWRLLLINIYTLWTVPLLLLASVVIAPEALVGSGEGKELEHRSLFARVLKAIFGRATEWVESLQ